jgi:hypothetical protein
MKSSAQVKQHLKRQLHHKIKQHLKRQLHHKRRNSNNLSDLT